MSGERVVAVFAHPDDESLLAGGTLAALADAGCETVVVCATRGENGLGGAGAEATASVRERELLAACRMLGATAETLPYRDGHLDEDPERLERDLESTFRRWQPRAVVTFGQEGLYWHPDHVALHVAATAAAETVRAGGAAPALYYATMPEGLVAALVAAVRDRDAPAELWGLDPNAFGAPESSITTVVDVRPQLRRKLAALRCHRSQLPERHVFATMPDDIAERFLGCEYFERAARRDADGDWLLEVLGRGQEEPAC